MFFNEINIRINRRSYLQVFIYLRKISPTINVQCCDIDTRNNTNFQKI